MTNAAANAAMHAATNAATHALETAATNDHRVRIVEVGLRDGLQNESVPVSTAQKLELIERLAESGLEVIEATAFVSPKWVPQMADQSEVMAGLPSSRFPQVAWPVLAPNLKGFEAAVKAGAKEVAVFAAASEAFSQRNINCSIAESIERFRPVTEAARAAGVRVRGYVSCVVECPYEGAIAPQRVVDVAERLRALGCYEISLGDTIGKGTPATIERMLELVAARIPMAQLAGHYHDTWGMGVANVYASWRMGMRVFDSSVAGLGGCPYAKGATGNVATEDVVYLLEGLGADTGVDLTALVRTARWISGVLGRPPVSRVGKAMQLDNCGAGYSGAEY